MPDGRFLDVTGPHDVAYLLDTYGDVLEADLGEIDQLHRVDDIGVYEVTTEHLRVEGIELDVECEAVAAYLLANLVSM